MCSKLRTFLVLDKIYLYFGVQYFREKLESLLPLLALFSVATEAVLIFILAAL